MNDSQQQLDNSLDRLYGRHAATEQSVDSVMREVDGFNLSPRRPPRRETVLAISTVAALVAVTGLLFLKLPPPAGSPAVRSLNQQPVAYQAMPAIQPAPGAMGMAEDRVVLDLSAGDDDPNRKQSILLPPWEATLIFTAQFGKPYDSPNGAMIPLEIVRVLKGPEVEGRLITPDQLPYFDCTPGEKFIPASTGLQPGMQVVAYLNQSGSSWALDRIEPLTPRFHELLHAAESEEPVKNMQALLDAEAGGVDQHAKLMLNLFLSKGQRIELLVGTVEAIPAELEKATPEQLDAIIGQQLVPAASILGDEKDPRLLRPILDSLPFVPKNELYKAHRGDLYLALGTVCQDLVYLEKLDRVDEADIRGVREVYLDSIRDCLNVEKMPRYSSDPLDPNPPLQLNWESSMALRSIGPLADSETITVLLKEQNRRPITRYHPQVIDALQGALSFPFHAIPHSPWIERADVERIKQSYLKTLLEFEPKDKDEFTAEGVYVSRLGGSLYEITRGTQEQTNRIPFTDEELQKLEKLYESQPEGWFRESLHRLFFISGGLF